MCIFSEQKGMRNVDPTQYRVQGAMLPAGGYGRQSLPIIIII